jgi:hypothetical protein
MTAFTADLQGAIDPEQGFLGIYQVFFRITDQEEEKTGGQQQAGTAEEQFPADENIRKREPVRVEESRGEDPHASDQEVEAGNWQRIPPLISISTGHARLKVYLLKK